MTRYNDSKNKPFLFTFLKVMVSVFYRKRTFIGIENIPNEPAIIIGNHAQMHGPLTSEMYFPTKKYIWCISNMMSIKEVPKYAYKDFWSHKPKIFRFFYKLLSYIIAFPSAYCFNKADTIAVYKDARLIHTFKTTIEKLNEGANIVIFPECEKEFNNIINEFQDKFIDVAKLYYKKYEKEISFVPMYNAPSLKIVVFGKPIKYNHELDIEKQRKSICDYLKQEITHIATSLPKHIVTPYLNIKKKNYPISK